MLHLFITQMDFGPLHMLTSAEEQTLLQLQDLQITIIACVFVLGTPVIKPGFA